MSVVEECYSLAMQDLENEVAKKLIIDRLSDLGKVEQDDSNSNFADYNQEHSKSNQELFGEAIITLAADDTGKASIYNLILNMSDCPEKSYLYALMALRSNMNDNGRINAMKYLQEAPASAQNDPRIKALAKILTER